MLRRAHWLLMDVSLLQGLLEELNYGLTLMTWGTTHFSVNLIASLKAPIAVHSLRQEHLPFTQMTTGNSKACSSCVRCRALNLLANSNMVWTISSPMILFIHWRVYCKPLGNIMYDSLFWINGACLIYSLEKTSDDEIEIRPRVILTSQKSNRRLFMILWKSSASILFTAGI